MIAVGYIGGCHDMQYCSRGTVRQGLGCQGTWRGSLRPPSLSAPPSQLPIAPGGTGKETTNSTPLSTPLLQDAILASYSSRSIKTPLHIQAPTTPSRQQHHSNFTQKWALLPCESLPSAIFVFLTFKCQHFKAILK